jgi:hypothetical protein
MAGAAGDLRVPSAGHPGSPDNSGPAESGRVFAVPPLADRGWHARNDLPGDAADFTGRDRELRELLAALPGQDEDAQAVVISAIDGMAGVGKTGVGKTALAVHAADFVLPGHGLGVIAQQVMESVPALRWLRQQVGIHEVFQPRSRSVPRHR